MACEKRFEVDTLLTADSVEWCPCDALHQVLACGTYHLDEEAGLRRGSLSLYEWNHSSLAQVLQPESKLISDGILDMKWHSVSERAVLALVLSSGTATFLNLEDKSVCEYSLAELGCCCVAEHELGAVLCLSLDWSKRSSDPPLVTVSDSKGYISLVELTQSGSRLSQRWKAHQFEAWIVVNGSDEHTVYSGGDDCRLCQWDTRKNPTNPTHISKRHTMGVCSLQMHPEIPHLLTSGSYDEMVCVWDTRNISKPLKEVCLGGGVWRIKWCPLNSDLVAAACMHNGFQVVDGHVRTGDPMEVLSTYSEHKSLAYGVDWCQLPMATSKDNKLTLASCSFYDHSLHIWSTTNGNPS